MNTVTLMLVDQKVVLLQSSTSDFQYSMCAGDETITSFARKFGGTRWGRTMMTYGGLVEKTSAGPCKSQMVVAYLVKALFLDSSPVLRSTKSTKCSIRVTVLVLGIYRCTQLCLF